MIDVHKYYDYEEGEMFGGIKQESLLSPILIRVEKLGIMHINNHYLNPCHHSSRP